MAKIKKSEKHNNVIHLMLQEYSTEQIAKETGYSISSIRHAYEDLREEYGVSSKTGITTAYLYEKLLNLRDELDSIISLVEPGSNNP